MASTDTPTATAHVWKFFRIGGLDQVAIETAADLLALEQLDQKLWVALSCPTKGLELDENTLALIDTDKDGRIRVPELLNAIKWATVRLKDPAVLLSGSDAVPLAAFNDTTAEGKALLAAAKEILASLGKASATGITLTEATDTAKVFAATTLNGDGIVTPSSTKDATLAALISDIVATTGGVLDRNGALGVNQALVDSFFADSGAFIAWTDAGAAPAVQPFGDSTHAASAAISAVRIKIDDYFARCQVAAFDARALGAMNRAEGDYGSLAAKDLTTTAADLAGFPLARIQPDQPLSLVSGLNPAWAARIESLRTAAIIPLFGPDLTTLTLAQWTRLKDTVAPYDAWMTAKAGATVGKLGLTRIRELLVTDQKAALSSLIAADAALTVEFASIGHLEKLLRFTRDFRTLLNNFVNFTDFYSPQHLATFQAGTLFLDSRSTEFCIRVDAPNPLAAMSKAYIAYCDCKRPGGKSMKIAACFTQGDSDYLFVGRNGIFYDRQGLDWDATITSIVDNPISIRQAFWSPYKKFVRFVEEQVAKRAAAADEAANSKIQTAATTTANADKAKPAEPKKFDLALITGIGVALGSIGGFLAAILTNFVNLGAWMPVGVLGIMLAISGPSMLIAWLKLRQRNLGPLLEGNGWAINGRVKINVPFGTRLTDRAVIPTNAKRSLTDPYEDKDATRRTRFITLLLAAVLAGLATAWWFRTWPFSPAQPTTIEAPAAKK